MYVCVAIPFVLNVWLVDIPAGATQEEGRAGFFHLHLYGAYLSFNAARLQPLLYTSIVKSDFVYERLIGLQYYIHIYTYIYLTCQDYTINTFIYSTFTFKKSTVIVH